MEKEQNAVMLKEDTSVGTVRIADDVVAMIASIAAAEVEGVQPLGVTPKNTKSVKGSVNPSKKSKGVKVEINDGIVRVEMAVSIEYGYSIPEVSGQLQSKVSSAIENMTGLTCGNINIRFASVIMK